jgi:hypothetical protein
LGLIALAVVDNLPKTQQTRQIVQSILSIAAVTLGLFIGHIVMKTVSNLNYETINHHQGEW